ncbi:GNAT family N-acetyltransferase [Amnibacterium kyonggiense]|uniref:GNAT family N-acetyltransferase n=1 Tax=Amnibacterium kyonggiense TaxID=595671 RepID=UPI001FE53080
MSEVRVRAARNADVPALERLIEDAFAPFTARTGIVPAPRSIDWATTISALGAEVAVLADRVVGVLVTWPHPDHLLVDVLAVAPSAQGSGVGRTLLAHARAAAARTGRDRLRLCTNAGMTASLAWYGRQGFVETDRRREDGFDRVFLEQRVG